MSVAQRVLAMAFPLAVGLLAQTAKKPDFSGTWQLDIQRTRFDKIPPPKSLVIEINHQEPQLRMVMVTNTSKGEARETMELTTDGKPQSLTEEGQPCTAAARWDQWSGTRLVVEVSCAGNTQSRRFKLGEKRKMLTTILTVKDRSGENKAYEFFVPK